MKIIETRPREIDFVLWGHCQNLLDDPRKSYEYYSFTVYKCQHAEITLVFVPTSIFTFSYTTDIK